MSKFQGNKINPHKFHYSQLKFYLILLPLAVFMLIPIIFMFTTAFKPYDELFRFPPSLFVDRPTFDNFTTLWDIMSSTSIPASRYLFNSILVAVLTVLISIFLSVSAGYILSKKNFKYRKLLFEINTLAIMFVPIAVSIPRFIIVTKLGLTDQFIANILPIVSMPIGLFLIKQFIDQIPDSLIEAAKMDGAGELGIIFKVIIPMIMPAIATVAILSFQAAWGNIEASTLFINHEELKTLAYYLSTFTSTSSGSIGQGMAAASALIMFVPNLIIFIFMQSKVMDTMAHSGIK